MNNINRNNIIENINLSDNITTDENLGIDKNNINKSYIIKIPNSIFFRKNYSNTDEITVDYYISNNESIMLVDGMFKDKIHFKLTGNTKQHMDEFLHQYYYKNNSIDKKILFCVLSDIIYCGNITNIWGFNNNVSNFIKSSCDSFKKVFLSEVEKYSLDKDTHFCCMYHILKQLN